MALSKFYSCSCCLITNIHIISLFLVNLPISSLLIYPDRAVVLLFKYENFPFSSQILQISARKLIKSVLRTLPRPLSSTQKIKPKHNKKQKPLYNLLEMKRCVTQPLEASKLKNMKFQIL